MPTTRLVPIARWSPPSPAWHVPWAVCAVLPAGVLDSTTAFLAGTGAVTGETGADDWYVWNSLLFSPWFLLGAVLFGGAARREGGDL